MDDQMIQKLCRVQLDENLDILNPESRQVRIYLCTTDTDMRVEKTELAEKVFPKISQLCRQQGLELQVVDLHTGPERSPEEYYLGGKKNLQELVKCKELSVGPNFILLVGQKFGYRLVPRELDGKTLATLKSHMKPEERDFVSRFYRKDKNRIPAVYSLTPDWTFIRALQLRNSWLAFDSLRIILQQAALDAEKHTQLDKHHLKSYFSSAFNEEASYGIAADSNPSRNIFCIRRVFSGLEGDVSNPVAPDYIDVFRDKQGKVNPDDGAATFLQDLWKTHVRKKVGYKNSTEFQITWRGNGVDRANYEHQEYLQKMCEKIESFLQQQIQALGLHPEPPIQHQLNHRLGQDLVLHRQLCVPRGELFFGHQDAIKEIRTYLLMTVGKPILVMGSHGSGKTSLLSRVAHSHMAWTGQAGITVFRSFGSGHGSSDLLSVLHSVCLQLLNAAGPVAAYELQECRFSPTKLMEYFQRLLSDHMVRNLGTICIVLDGIDNMTPKFCPWSLWWVPKPLPPNVKMVLSVNKEFYDSMTATSAPFLSRMANTIDISQTFGYVAACETVILQLRNNTMKLQPTQYDAIMTSFNEHVTPMKVALTMGNATLLKSYMSVESIYPDVPVKVQISSSFERLEASHGSEVVQITLKYITLASPYGGLSENELALAVMRDPLVVKSRLEHELEPSFPLREVLFILRDLAPYLQSVQASGDRLLFWNNKVYENVAKAKYISEISALDACATLAEIFKEKIGLSGEEKPPTELDPVTPTAGDILSQSNARYVTLWPCFALQAGKYEEVKTILFSFHWFMLMVFEKSLSSAFQTYEAYLDKVNDPHVELLKNLLVTYFPLLDEPFEIGSYILGTSMNVQDNVLKSINVQATQLINEFGGSLVYPVNQCLKEPSDVVTISKDASQHLLGLSQDGNQLLMWSRLQIYRYRLENNMFLLECHIFCEVPISTVCNDSFNELVAVCSRLPQSNGNHSSIQNLQVGTVIIYNFKTFIKLTSLEGNKVHFCPTSKLMVLEQVNGVNVLETDTFQKKATIVLSKSAGKLVTCKVASSEKVIILEGEDGSFSIYAILSGKMKWSMMSPLLEESKSLYKCLHVSDSLASMSSVEISTTRNYMIMTVPSAVGHSWVVSYDLSTGKPLRCIIPNSLDMGQFQLFADTYSDMFVASVPFVDGSGIAHLCNAAKGTSKLLLEFPIKPVIFHPNGKWLLYHHDGGPVNLWCIHQECILHQFTGPEVSLLELHLDTTGSRLLIVGSQNVTVCSIPQHIETGILDDTRNTDDCGLTTCLQVSTADQLVLVGTSSGIIPVYRIQDGCHVGTCRGHVTPVTAIAVKFSMAASVSGLDLILWNVLKFEPLKHFQLDRIGATGLVFITAMESMLVTFPDYLQIVSQDDNDLPTEIRTPVYDLSLPSPDGMFFVGLCKASKQPNNNKSDQTDDVYVHDVTQAITNQMQFGIKDGLLLAVDNMAVSTNSCHVAISAFVGEQPQLFVCNLASCSAVPMVLSGIPSKLAFSDTHVIGQMEQGKITLWKLKSGKPQKAATVLLTHLATHIFTFGSSMEILAVTCGKPLTYSYVDTDKVMVTQQGKFYPTHPVRNVACTRNLHYIVYGTDDIFLPHVGVLRRQRRKMEHKTQHSTSKMCNIL